MSSKPCCWLLLNASWACSPLKSKTMTWLRFSDGNQFVHCEIFRAGMENKQILDRLCQDNGIIQIENGRGQFSHNHVFCLIFFLSLLFPSLSFSFYWFVVCTQTHMPFSIYCSMLSLFSVNSWCGNVEQNLHRKQSPIRIALFMSRQCAAYKKGKNAWIRTKWATLMECTFLNLHTFMHTGRDARKHTHP